MCKARHRNEVQLHRDDGMIPYFYADINDCMTDVQGASPE